MKLVFISLMEGFPWGGSEELWVKVADYSLEQGHQVSISVKNWQPLHAKITGLVDKGALLHTRTVKLPTTITQRVIKKVIGSKNNQQWLWLKQEQPNVVIINMGGAYDVAKYPALIEILQQLAIPYYLIQQFNYENFVLPTDLRHWLKQVFVKAEKIFFVSERNKITTERNLAVHLTNTAVVSNPANLQVFTAVPYPNVINDAYCLAVVARLDAAYKGQDLLVQVLSQVQWQSRNWKLNIYGTGPDEVYLKELTELYQLSQHVVFKGSTHDIRSIWQENHLLVLPSVAEGTPLSLIEAMVCARTAVVTDVGGNTDLINNGINGFVAYGTHVGLLSNALETAWSKRELWQQMGEAARNTALEKIDLQSYLTIYKAIAQK